MATGEIKLLTMGGEKFDVTKISDIDKEERRLDIVCIIPGRIHTIDMELTFDNEGNQSCKINEIDATHLDPCKFPITKGHEIMSGSFRQFVHRMEGRIYHIFTGRRLPGSLRTKRLRQKRAKALGILNAR